LNRTNATETPGPRAYTVDDLPDTLTEHTGVVQTAFTDFSYDNRHRLIGEVRTGTGQREASTG